MSVSASAPPGAGVRVLVPATSANLGPGFDCLALALDLQNTILVEPGTPGSGLRIEARGEGAESLARDDSNLVVTAMRRLAAAHGRALPADLMLLLHNAIPLGRGLGSSAAAIAGGVLAAALLLDLPARPEALLPVALSLEGHPDNVVAALWGGLTVGVLDGERAEVRRLDPPAGLQAVLLVPERFVSTALSRGVLPAQVSRRDAVFNASRCALLIADLACGRYDGLRVAMQDRLHQPYRGSSFPYLDAAIDASLSAGAHGAALSGSGSGVIALVDGACAGAVGAALGAVAARFGLPATVRTCALSAHGAREG